jgi:hypothetical protein
MVVVTPERIDQDTTVVASTSLMSLLKCNEQSPRKRFLGAGAGEIEGSTQVTKKACRRDTSELLASKRERERERERERLRKKERERVRKSESERKKK